jgi:squalene cyclase
MEECKKGRFHLIIRNMLACLLILFTCLTLSARETTVPISAELSNSLNKGLKFLAASQQDDGSWSGNYGRNVGETSLCLMAFISMGNLPGEGEYGHVVGKGVNWVVDQAKPNGLIQYSNQEKQAAVMYGHALATLMLSEAWGQSRNNKIGKVLRNAVKLILEVQGKKGGWGYKSVPEDGDTSVMVMQIIALKSAQDAGIYVPQKTIQKSAKTTMDPVLLVLVSCIYAVKKRKNTHQKLSTHLLPLCTVTLKNKKWGIYPIFYITHQLLLILKVAKPIAIGQNY